MAAPSLAQAAVFSSTITGTTQVQAVFGSNTTTGNTVVALICGYSGATLRTVSTVTLNSASLTKQLAQPGVASNYTSSEGWAIANITGSATKTVLATFSGTVTLVNLWILEFANMPSALTLDGSKASTGVTGNFSGGPITITRAPSVAFAICSTAGSGSAVGAGWTGIVAGSSSNLLEYQIFTSAQASLTATGTNSGAYGYIVFALDGIVAAGGAPATGTLVFSGTATGRVSVKALGTGTLIITGTGRGRTSVKAQSAGTLVFSGTASVRVAVRAPGTGTLIFTGAAAGRVSARSTASGTLVFTGTANARQGQRSAATGTLVITGTAQSKAAVRAQATGTLIFTGTAAAHQVQRSTASGTLVFTGSGAAHIASLTEARGTLIFTGTAVVEVRYSVHGSGSLVFTGTAFARIHLPPVNPVAPYTGHPQEDQIDVPASIRYREDEWEEGPWVLPPYALIFPQPPEPVCPERGSDAVHAAWLETHPRPSGPRRLGDHNHRPQSVLAPFPRSKPVKTICLSSPLTQARTSSNTLTPRPSDRPRRRVPR